MWAAIAGAFAVVIALAGVIGYLVNSYRGAEDGEDEAEARARASTDAAHDAELSLAKSRYDASSTIDNLRDEQAMLQRRPRRRAEEPRRHQAAARRCGESPR